MKVTLYRPANKSSRITIQMPYAPNNRFWLREITGGGTQPQFDKSTRQWTLARKHERAAIEGLVQRYGRVEVTRDYNSMETCTASCRNAKSDECVCSCGGTEHGGGIDLIGEKLVNDEVIVRWSIRRRVSVVTHGKN